MRSTTISQAENYGTSTERTKSITQNGFSSVTLIEFEVPIETTCSGRQ